MAENYTINNDGFVTQAQQIASPNFDARPDHEISMIVIHNISLPPSQYGGNGIIELFTNQLNPDEHPYYATIHSFKVSAHFLIRRDGTLIQFVSCLERAWHAGKSNWQTRERCNDFSVGIELEGSDFEAFEEVQYQTLNKLVASLKRNYAIQAIVGHSDIAPDRKTDPGPYFDWQKLTHHHH
ncbi:1,6-anhydro-N-acetylmuramyl-L-alanine amidase AmpD [Methylotenera mobilis]|uniref:1,6-anhydro-N-acetylmuramyl-L-alanine amidase AmpD n=1 Tax=Methylotenera mobilis (strain JLW8 / ATCC BAA-1282 / DSM 17540) TaxID=583345 RepID=C6WT56_METML|nr:1,6-anhydro-N-acetylmuramyl-L-alanine amidase AmpD [Methylotenera mobilis]ACT49118.1 N-acetylmuramyl-L-alanine amidase, negative regulator of AmpC, AmpD [Methylotenera mobilis JLW8]